MSGDSNQTAALIPAQRKLRELLLADPHRPLWHFISPEGWCMPFDPNGAIFWNGRYHLCYIYYNELGPCWGHASSHDLVHWRWHTPALVTATADIDKGIFSGNAFVNKDGVATIMFHGCNSGNSIAICTDPDLNHWTKSARNPIIPNPAPDSPEAKLYQSWDPHGWVENDTYYAIFGGTPGSGAPPTLFKGETLDKWKYVGPFMMHDMPDVADFEDVSCPDFFAMGDRHVLVCISHTNGARYYVGKWENEKFTPELHRRMNWAGGTCFAPESLLDDKGRRIMWTWALEAHTETPSPWGGTMTLPRILSMAPDHTLYIDPVPELEQLRTKPVHHQHIDLKAGIPIDLANVRGDSLELDLKVQTKTATRIGLKIRRSAGGEEETVILCDLQTGTLRIDVSKASLNKEITYRTFVMKPGENPHVTAQEAPFTLNLNGQQNGQQNEPLHLRVFLDRSILEVFANRRQCITQRIYPTRPDSLGITFFSEGGDATIESLQAWEMAPSNMC